MNVLVFTDNDLDGAGSALFIEWLYSGKSTTLKVVEATEYSIVSEFLSHNINEYDKVFILDLDLSKEQIPQVDIEKVVVFDHHKQHEENKYIYKKAKVVVKQSSSCVALIHSKFKDKINLSPEQEELVNYIDDYDSYKLHHKDSLKLNAIHKTLNNPKAEKFIEAFRDGFRPYNIQEKNGIRLFIKKFKEQLESQVFVGKIKTYKTVSIISNYAVSEVAHYIISKHDAEIGIVVNLETNTVSFRRAKGSDVDVSIIAKALCGGGGSAAIAGGKLTEQFANLTKNFLPC